MATKKNRKIKTRRGGIFKGLGLFKKNNTSNPYSNTNTL